MDTMLWIIAVGVAHIAGYAMGVRNERIVARAAAEKERQIAKTREELADFKLELARAPRHGMH
jgi:uncharacterized membrane-anchored protein YhcB (DUF1043 family)